MGFDCPAENHATPKSVEVEYRLLDPRNNMQVIASGKKSQKLELDSLASFSAKITKPALWSAETPNLYKLLITLKHIKTH